MRSMSSCDHFLHDLPASRLQWPHAAPGQEPHAFILIAAVKNVDAVACDRVMECGAGVFGNESEESFAPWVIGVTENLFAKLLNFSKLIVQIGFAIPLRPSLLRV